MRVHNLRLCKIDWIVLWVADRDVMVVSVFLCFGSGFDTYFLVLVCCLIFCFLFVWVLVFRFWLLILIGFIVLLTAHAIAYST